MNDILSDLTPSKYKLKSNNNQSNSIQNNTTNATKGDLLADLNSGKYKLKGSEPQKITQTEVQKGIEQLNSPIGILGTVRRTTETKLPEIISEKKLEREEQERWDSLSVPEKIVDPFKTMGANIKHTDLGLKESQAWTEYRSKQDEESLAKAQAATKAREEYEASNDRIGKGNAFTKDFAAYIPQMLGQIGAGVGNAAGGAAAGAGTALAIGQLGPQVGLPEELITVPTGALWGGRAGYVAGTGKYNYDLVVGTAYKTLLDMGVPNDIALELSGNEAVINGAIEALGSMVDLASFGAGSAVKEPLKRFLTGAVKSYVANLISEPTEEGLQRKVSIEIEKEAAKRAGIERNVSEAEDWQSILDDMKAARNVALFTGLGNVGGNIVNNVMQTNKNTNINTRKLPTIDNKTLTQLTEINKNIEEQQKASRTAQPEKNVARELPTMASQQAMLPTNRIEGGTAQTGNMEQMAKNKEKVAQFSKKTDAAGEKPAFSMPEIPKGHTRLYRGLTQEYNKNYDKSKLDNSNGYESWTDNYELAKAYGDNVYYIDIPTNEIKNDIIDNDSTSETYGDRNLIYFNDKPVGIKGQSGKEYMLYADHENYPNLEYKSVQTNLNNLENQQEIGYNEIARKPEPKNYVYKRITNSDKARISSDYMVNANKYTEDIGSVDFSDVSYIYQKKNNEIEILKKFKGSQEFINSIKGEWRNGTNEMPERNNKVNESVRDERRQSNIANGGARRTRESGTSNRPDSRLGGQRGDINGEQVGKNNSDGIKDSEKSSFSLPETDNQGRKLSAEQQEFFKDSKVRDEDGNLQLMYHGTNADFNAFEHKFIGNDNKNGLGFYFTPHALQFKYDYPKTVYLNIKNPATSPELIDVILRREEELLKTEQDREKILLQIQKEFGVDGIIDKNRGNQAVAFFSNQIKNVDNAKPTSNPDIRYFASSESSRPYMDLDRYTSRDNKSKANKVGLTDIQNAINDIVTVKTGKFRQNAYGIYKTHGEIIRLKQMKDIPVALHELTHHLDKMYNLSSSDKAFNELKKIAVVGENATKQTIISEGVAEFGRYYMTDKEYAKEIAPSYYDAFEKALDGDPTMKAKVENIRQMVTNYLDQSPLNRLSSNIDYGDEDVSLWQKGKDAIIKTANTFRKNFVDDLDPLKKIVNEISGAKKLMTEEDAYKLLRLNNGVTGKVQVALEYGVLDKKGEKVSKSLKGILEPVANNQKEFVAYLTALRANDLQNRGIESGMLSRDVNDVIKMYKGNETFNNAAKELYNFQNKILETTLIDSGIITKDALDAYNKNNPHYVPFYRVMDENFKQSKSSKAKKPTKIKGSTRDIINPLESIIKNTYSYMQMAERNDTFKVLFDMANKYDGTGKWFDKVPTDMMATKVTAEDVKGILEQLNLGDEDVNYNEIFTTLFSPANNQKGNIVTVMQKGKPVHYEIMDKELFDILSPEIKSDNKLAKIMQFPAKTLRVGATHTPEFILRNPIRDTIDASIYSRNDFKPFMDTIIGIFNVAGRTDLYYKWLQSGGSGSTYTNAQRPVLQKTLKGLTEGVTQEKAVKKVLKGVGNLVKHPLRTYLDVAGTISNVAEEGTRVGEFRRALQQGKTEKEAALDSREITLDFSRGGEVAKNINKYVAFFNAELQGLDKMFTSFKDRPVATTIKAFIQLSLPAMILRALQDEEKLEKVPQWEKDEFFIIFVGDTPIKIPKAQGLGQLFATIPERIIDYVRTHDKDAFDGLVQRLVTSYIPSDGISSILPSAFLPLIELAVNEGGYSFFKQQPIVNQSLQNRSPKYQYDENTSTIAKTLGELADNIPFVEGGISPKKIDHLISGYFGNLGKDAANLIGMPIDLLSGNKKDNEYKSLNSKLKKVPLLKGFIASDYASKSLDKFYKSKDEVSTKYTDAKFNVTDGKTTATEKAELKYYKELNSLYNKAYNEIKELDEQIDAVTNGKGNDKYKETKIEQLKDKKDNIADKVEKQKELKGFNVKFNK